MRIDIEEAGKQLGKLGSYAQIGEKVVITKDGEPYMELVACPEHKESRKKKPRVPGTWKGKVWMAPDFDETPEDIIDSFYDSVIFPSDDEDSSEGR